MTKPRILWLADVPGWAYESIVYNVGRQLPDCENMIWYIMAPRANDGLLFRQLCEAADVIVAMYVLYVKGVPGEYHHKVVPMLTGFRPFEAHP